MKKALLNGFKTTYRAWPDRSPPWRENFVSAAVRKAWDELPRPVMGCSTSLLGVWMRCQSEPISNSSQDPAERNTVIPSMEKTKDAELPGIQKPIITFEGIHHAFAESGGKSLLSVVNGFNLSIADGEFVSLIGPSGCGKSTLLNMAAGFLQPDQGQVLLLGKSPVTMRKDIGMVFQSYSLLSWRTVLDNVTLGLEFRGIPRAQRSTLAKELISSLGLRGFEHRYPRELSGGMNQRVTLARALVLQPRILLLDEPFGALDEQTRILIGDELLRLWEKIRPTTLLVTHSISEAVRLSNRVVVLSARPATVKEVISINLERPRDGRRSTEMEERIWELLKDEAARAMLGRTDGDEV